ncbi:MAG: hypothetical protein ABSD74_01360 [Rhizomicrobium sp.]|jgi:hypothetical protein
MMRALAVSCALALAGCGLWSSTIKTEIANYDNVIEETTDELLLINILEARDKAPLHFGEVPKVNGSLQATASVASGVPFVQTLLGNTPNMSGTNNAATGIVQGTVTPTISAQSAPSFEVDNLDTKDFVTGMSSPLDPKFIKYWIDRGIDSRLLMLLFLSSIQIESKKFLPQNGSATKAADVVITIQNSPRVAADFIATCLRHDIPDHCHSRIDFEYFLRFVNGAMNSADVTANAYTERTRLKKAVSMNSYDIAQFDSPQYDVERSLEKGKYDVFSAGGDAKNIAICFDKIPVGGKARRTVDTDSPSGPVSSTSGRRRGQKSKHTKRDDSHDVCTVPTVVDDTPTKPGDPPTQLVLDSGKPPCPEAGSPTSPYCDVFQQFIVPIICVEKSINPENKDLLEACRKPGLEQGSTLPQTESNDYSLTFKIRSVAEIVHFLGDLLYYQKVLNSDTHHNIPVTLDYDWKCHDVPESNAAACLVQDGGAIFEVNDPDVARRFSVNYRGNDYSVAEYSPRDHTLEVIAIVNQLMDLNKAATDIRATPLVQAIP